MLRALRRYIIHSTLYQRARYTLCSNFTLVLFHEEVTLFISNSHVFIRYTDVYEFIVLRSVQNRRPTHDKEKHRFHQRSVAYYVWELRFIYSMRSEGGGATGRSLCVREGWGFKCFGFRQTLMGNFLHWS